MRPRRWRHQPPAYSPLPVGAPLAAVRCLLPLGPDPRDRLRASLARAHGAADVVLCGSGTQALLLALRLAARRRKQPLTVALPAYSCYDVASAAVAAGVRVQLYDVDAYSLGPALESLESALRDGAEAVVAAHLYGLPIDWAAVSRLCNAFGATLIEDAAQGFGGSWGGRPLGSLGELAVLSFGRGKGWTGARGGALLLNADWMAVAGSERLRRTTAAQAVTTAALAGAMVGLSHPSVYGIPAALPALRLGETIYRDAAAPAEMSPAAAAVLESSRLLAEREAAARRSNAAAMSAALRTGPGLVPIVSLSTATAGFLRLPLRLAGGMSSFPERDLALRLGIAPGYPAPLSSLAPLRLRLSRDRPLPGAAELALELVTLPTHSRLDDTERATVLRLVNSAAR